MSCRLVCPSRNSPSLSWLLLGEIWRRKLQQFLLRFLPSRHLHSGYAVLRPTFPPLEGSTRNTRPLVVHHKPSSDLTRTLPPAMLTAGPILTFPPASNEHPARSRGGLGFRALSTPPYAEITIQDYIAQMLDRPMRSLDHKTMIV